MQFRYLFSLSLSGTVGRVCVIVFLDFITAGVASHTNSETLEYCVFIFTFVSFSHHENYSMGHFQVGVSIQTCTVNTMAVHSEMHFVSIT